MSWHLVTRPEVESDIDEGAQWYEKREPGIGLGKEFAREVWRTIDQLLHNPLLYRVRDPKLQVRWVVSPRFPYRIVYVVKNDWIVILDREWKKRAK